MNTEEDLKSGLRVLADQPYSPLRTDIAEARTKGRRIKLRRRVAAVGGTALTIGVAAVTVTAVLPSGTARPVTADRTATTAHRPNPFISKASFGWLPAGFSPSTIMTEQGIFELSATREDPVAASQLFLSVFPPGPEPMLGNMRDGVPAKAVKANPVAGRPAHWLQPPPPGPGTAPGEARLRFQIGANQWAELELDAAPPGTDIASTIYRAADAIRMRDMPTALPMQVKGIPESFAPNANVSVSTDPKAGMGWRSAMFFQQGLQIIVTRHGDKQPITPNTTVAGHPAYHAVGMPAGMPHPAGALKPGKDREALYVYGVSGLDISFTSEGQAFTTLKASGGLMSLYKQTTLYGTDPAHWTVYPLG